MTSRSYLGNSYSLPNGIANNTIESYCYLAGEHNIKVIEIEVYSVKFQ